jgi:hypothetical protein
LPIVKIQNGAQFQDGRQHVYDFFKSLQDCLNLANCSSFIFFLKNTKWPKYSRGTAQWNVSIFGYVILLTSLLTLFYYKKNCCQFWKNQNGGYIQDGVENVCIFHAIFSKIIFLSIFLLFLFTLGKNRGKNKTFMEKNFLKIQNGGII